MCHRLKHVSVSRCISGWSSTHVLQCVAVCVAAGRCRQHQYVGQHGHVVDLTQQDETDQ